MIAHPEPVKSKAEMVVRVCLTVSLVVGVLLVLVAWVGNRGLLAVSSTVATTVAFQWFIYLLVRSKSAPKVIDSDC